MQKQIYVEGFHEPIVLARRKGAKHLKITLKNDGVIRVTLPYGVSESAAHQFVRDRQDWITKHRKPRTILTDNTRIGKSHVIRIRSSVDNSSIRTRIKFNTAYVSIPAGVTAHDPAVQQAIRRVCERALALEAENLLPQRLESIARTHNLTYRSLTTRKLKSRWGSCDERNNITLNTYLIQLPWHLIDYVIVHELAHTLHKHHQASFWEEVDRMLPDWKALRKELKTKPTDIIPTNF